MVRMATDELRSVDERILAALGESGPDYVPVIATRLGLPSKYAGRRAGILADNGLIEPVDGGAIYRLTERGERRLANETVTGPGGSRTAEW
jgi:predicted ArsR family transcriptional regulator